MCSRRHQSWRWATVFLAVLCVPAHAIPPDHVVDRHLQKWDPVFGQWLHNPDDCPRLVPYEDDWDFEYLPNGIQGAGREEEFLFVALCNTTLGPGLDRAFESLEEAGLLFVASEEECWAVGGHKNSWGFVRSVADDKQWILDEQHGLWVVTDPDSAVYDRFFSGTGLMGVSPIVSVSFTDENGNAVPTPGAGPRTTWEVFLNDVDGDFSDELPADVLRDGGGETHFFADIATHELLHVVGLGHTEAEWLSFPSSMHGGTPSAYLGVHHQALQQETDLYYLGVPRDGVQRIHAADQVFLQQKYGVPGWDWNVVRALQWRPNPLNMQGSGYWPVGNLGPDATPLLPFPVYDGGLFNEEACGAGIADFPDELVAALLTALPSFVSTEGADLEVEFTTLDLTYILADSPNIATLAVSGHVNISVPVDGRWSLLPTEDAADPLAFSVINHAKNDGTTFNTMQFVSDVYDVTGGEEPFYLGRFALDVTAQVKSCAEEN